MSTLSAARADNFYYPPGWDPSKESLNQHTGHTKGRNQYEQKGLNRFEYLLTAGARSAGDMWRRASDLMPVRKLMASTTQQQYGSSGWAAPVYVAGRSS